MSTINITAKEFRDLVTPVMPFAGRDDMLPVLTAVRIKAHDGWITATATDRFRAAMRRVKREGVQPGFSALIGAADLKRLLAAFKPTRWQDPVLTLTTGDEGRVTFEQEDGVGFFDGLRATVVVKDGELPNVESLIAKALAAEASTLATAYRADFLADLKHFGVSGATEIKLVPARAGNSAHRHDNSMMLATTPDMTVLLMPRWLDVSDNPLGSTLWADFLTPAEPTKAAS